MSERDVMASLDRLEAIEESVSQVLGDKRWWLTPEEFLANVEAHRRKHDQERLNPKPIDHKPAEAREYQLKRHVTYSRQLDLKRLEVSA
jgi:hypothetical protein